MIIWRPKWTESSLQNWNAFTRPKDKTILFFSGSPTQWPWQGCCCNLPWESNAVRRSSVPPPTLQTLQTLPLPRPLAFVRLDPPACRAGLTSAGLEAAGPDGCLLGRIHFPCGYVCLWCMCLLLRCFSCSHTVLPKEHSLGLFFFSSPSSCHAVFFFNSTCISLLIILCMIVYVTNNKEPWTLEPLWSL